jgi:lipopolysaccharide export system protein LptA
MKILLAIFSFSITIFLALLILPQVNSFSQLTKTSQEASSESPLVINSDRLEVDQKKRVIIFEGNVRAMTDDMVVDCQKMIVYYLDKPTEKGSGMGARRIDKIIASGDVTINRSDGAIARAGKAVFYQNEDKAVLTESPIVRQGPDFVEGHRITLFLSENRSIIEGSEEQRVKATIFPKEEKRK